MTVKVEPLRPFRFYPWVALPLANLRLNLLVWVCNPDTSSIVWWSCEHVLRTAVAGFAALTACNWAKLACLCPVHHSLLPLGHSSLCRGHAARLVKRHFVADHSTCSTLSGRQLKLVKRWHLAELLFQGAPCCLLPQHLQMDAAWTRAGTLPKLLSESTLLLT